MYLRRLKKLRQIPDCSCKSVKSAILAVLPKIKITKISFLRQFLSKLLEPRFFSFHGLWFLTVTVTADDDCAPEAAASWIQMKLHYDINEQSDEGTRDLFVLLSQAGRIPGLKNFWG